MKKPFRYSIICNRTKLCIETNTEPITIDLQTWVSAGDPNVSKLEVTKTAYVDIRYDARIRLYNYIAFTKKGLKIPRYDPFKSTNIGRSIPILNF